ncbi:hypothetical protein VUR80DRAFT_4902 [Thermomyces stellatus]
MEDNPRPQASLTTLAPRLRTYQNSLLTPVLPSAQNAPLSRTTKRGTTIINYAEDGYDDLEDDDSDTRRRPTGLRSMKKEDSASRQQDLASKVGKETFEPVNVTGQWREWMARSKILRSNQQAAAQANLPLTLIPIRIDLDIPAFTPQPPFPVPPNMQYDPSLPQYRPQETTVPYRLRDFFLWNLHETIITTDQFALTLVQDLDLPNPRALAAEISKQIRTQLEEYAGVALHPLFHSLQDPSGPRQTRPGALSQNGLDTPTPTPAGQSRADTPMNGTSTPRITTSQAPEVTANAAPITPDSDDFNPDDTYRCVINITLNLASTLYTDKFEWSLLHPPGTAEAFAKQTCADLGLAGEWVPALTHAIYEAVLRLKKEACESGGVVGQDMANDAAQGAGEGGGWRYEPEGLADEWEPKIEVLTKEEMEKREGDRERQIRRLRRETARFSSTSGLVGGVPFSGFGNMVEADEERMGRGERNRRRRRLRSISPGGRQGTPGARGTPDAGYGGGGALADAEREQWRCTHCGVRGTSVWAVRDGPSGPKTLCNNCGYLYERDRRLPRLMKNLHQADHRVL